MNNIKFLFIFIMLFTMCNCCYADSIYDIRKVKWGMNIQQVLQSEKPKKPIDKSKDSLMFKDKIFDYPAIILYNFQNDKLISAMITLYDFSSVDSMVMLYEKSKSMLSNKYNQIVTGDPARSEFESPRTSITLLPTTIESQHRLFFMYGDKNRINDNSNNAKKRFNQESEQF